MVNARAQARILQTLITDGHLTGMRGLKYCRQRMGYSRADLSKITGITKQSIGTWERQQSWPSAYQLPRLASALRCSIEELYLGPDMPEDPEVDG